MEVKLGRKNLTARGLMAVAVMLALCVVVMAFGVACGSDSGSSASDRSERERSDDRDEDEENQEEDSDREKSGIRALMERQTSQSAAAAPAMPFVPAAPQAPAAPAQAIPAAAAPAPAAPVPAPAAAAPAPAAPVPAPAVAAPAPAPAAPQAQAAPQAAPARPTATPRPTAAPMPTATPEATATPAATATPRPTPTPTPVPYWAENYSTFVLETDNVQMWDVAAFKGGEPPAQAQAMFNTVWDDPDSYAYSNKALGIPGLYIEELIPMDEVEKIAVHGTNNPTMIAEGSFDFESIRQKLEKAEFNSGTYRRHEIWEGRIRYDGYYVVQDVSAVSLIEASGLVVMTYDISSLQHFLRVYGGDPGLLIDVEEPGTTQNYVKQALDRVGQGWFVRAEYVGSYVSVVGMAMSNGDTEHSVRITWALMYGDEDQAEDGGRRLSEVGYFYDLIKVEDVKVDENFVIVEASVDEDDLPLLPQHYYYNIG